MNYITKNLRIDIYISSDDIVATDKVKIYDNRNPSVPTLLAELRGVVATENPSWGDSYLFSFSQKVSEIGTYSYYYTALDKYGNESDVVNYFEDDICLTPYTPAALKLTQLTWGSSFDGSATPLATDYQVIYRAPENNPSDITVVGYWGDSVEDFNILAAPVDGDYIYWREYKSYSCGTTSAASSALNVNFTTGIPGQLAQNDADNVVINPTENGNFNITFTYQKLTNEVDGCDTFYIYYDKYENPSDIGTWTLDGSISFYSGVGKYMYTTTVSHTHGDTVAYIVVPASGSNERNRDAADIVTATAYKDSPVIITDSVTITLT